MKTYLWAGLAAALLVSSVSSQAQARAKYEPEQGCYIGAVLDWADLANKGEGKDSVEKFANGMKAFNDAAKKPHALYEQFIFFPHGADWEDKGVYNKYATWDSDPCGWSTAKEFAAACDRVNATPVFTIEPYVVKDFYTDWKPGNPAYDNTLAFAKGCGAYGKPVFIRFAHEMNGSWYPWCSWLDKNLNQTRDPGEETDVTPEHYVAAFRNFAAVMHQYAPNAAMIWCPNQGWLGEDVQQDNYNPWYPGDESADWVGLDFYERGWYLPHPGAKLWGGQFARGLHYDSLDKPGTTANESVDFYKVFCVEKKKPLMLCETAAEQTYRTDLTPEERRGFSHDWKTRIWDAVNVGWLRAVYATSNTKEKVFGPIDQQFPMLKGVVWFNFAKAETLPAMKRTGKTKEIVWFKDAFADYRIGWNAPSEDAKYAAESKFPDENELYARLIGEPYFLSAVPAEKK